MLLPSLPLTSECKLTQENDDYCGGMKNASSLSATKNENPEVLLPTFVLLTSGIVTKRWEIYDYVGDLHMD